VTDFADSDLGPTDEDRSFFVRPKIKQYPLLRVLKTGLSHSALSFIVSALIHCLIHVAK
jgi:hypothetical protein